MEQVITFPLKLLDEALKKGVTNVELRPDGTLVACKVSSTGSSVDKETVLVKGRIGSEVEDFHHVSWIIDRIDKQSKKSRDASARLDTMGHELRSISMELKGKMRGVDWCCSEPDIEITPQSLEKRVERQQAYNNYHCKNCGKKWLELVKLYGSGFDIDFIMKEIDDYRKGYIKEPKLRCPVCHSASLRVLIVNEDKKTHHYDIRCWNAPCKWKSNPIPHGGGYLKDKEPGGG